MDQAKKEVAEIRRMSQAIKVTKSEKLKADYTKSIECKKRELRRYCRYRGISYAEVWK